MSQAPDSPLDWPWPPSFLKRQGHVTRAQKRALRQLWGRYGVDARYGHPIDLDVAFGRRAGRVLEIGFGHGENLMAQAAARPELDFVGVEPHRPGLGALLMELEEAGLDNVRLIRGDALYLLHFILHDPAFDELQIFFPDPWPRPKDHGRRVVRPETARLFAQRLRPGAHLYLATDVEGYARQMLEVLEGDGAFVNLAEGGGFSARLERRPVTRYEEKAHEEGRQVYDLHFRLAERA